MTTKKSLPEKNLNEEKKREKKHRRETENLLKKYKISMSRKYFDLIISLGEKYVRSLQHNLIQFATNSDYQHDEERGFAVGAKKLMVLFRRENQIQQNQKKKLSIEEIQQKVFVYDEKGNFQLSKTIYNLASYFIEEESILTFDDSEEIFIYSEGVYSPNADKKISKISQKVLSSISKNNLIKEILGHIKRMSYQNRKKIKEPEKKICLENGILNLSTMRIEDFSPEMIFFNKLPIKFVETTDCPKIKKFLKEIVEEEDIILLQEFAGYCLLKNYFIHKSFMLVGEGANGKSTFLNLLRAFLGKENVSSVPLQRLENNRFSLSSLFGKLANIFADLPAKALAGTSIFKMLVGEDLIPAEKKFKDEFFFENYAKMIFSANQIPKSPEDTTAFFRRWIIINFPNQFMGKKADKKLLKKISTSEELSGFLNFAIVGLKRILENQDFSSTKSVERTREQYIRMSDSVGAFVMDKILISPDDYVEKKSLYTSYCDYCRENGYPVSAENTFHKDLQAKIRIEDYRPLVDGKRIYCWKGVKIGGVKNDFQTP